MNLDLIRTFFAVALFAVSLSGCGGGSGSTGDRIAAGGRVPASGNADSQTGSLSHVHGIGRNPKGGDVYLATHHGLWRMRKDADPDRVGNYLHDFMGFSVVGPDHFIASGHPNSAPSMPPHMGLIESTDAGNTWTNRSLLGEADFHTLRSVDGRTFGWNSQDGALMVSSDLRDWNTIVEDLMMVDVAIEPAQQDVMVASVPRDQRTIELQRSTDGGASFGPVKKAPQLARFAWSEKSQLWGFAPDGRVWLSTDQGESWERVGELDALPDAVTSTADEILAAVEGSVMRSTDQGRSWKSIHEYEA
ncbi:MAG: hypothetical protein JWM90_2865 [Thermoleophilia bacterium]|nr:hypothetical protein [Thermoleophilia bacterium]